MGEERDPGSREMEPKQQSEISMDEERSEQRHGFWEQERSLMRMLSEAFSVLLHCPEPSEIPCLLLFSLSLILP
jgi:hypothetical protein